MIEEIIHNKSTLALIIRRDYEFEGVKFFTPEHYSQQLAYMSHKKGHIIDAHSHKNSQKIINLTQEVLVIKSGILRVDFYTSGGDYIKSKFLYSGDVILLASQGHGFEVIEDVTMFEIKQGPFDPKLDKIKFNNIDKKSLKIE